IKVLVAVDCARADGNEQLCARTLGILIPEQGADHRQGVQVGNAGIALPITVLDKAAKDDGVTTLNGHGAFYRTLEEWQLPGDRVSSATHIGHFLLDIHDHQPAGIYTGAYLELHAGILEGEVFRGGRCTTGGKGGSARGDG